MSARLSDKLNTGSEQPAGLQQTDSCKLSGLCPARGRRSLRHNSLLALLLLLLITGASLLQILHIYSDSHSKAAAINLAGSLRMQAWRIASTSLEPDMAPFSQSELLARYHRTLDHPALAQLLSEGAAAETGNQDSVAADRAPTTSHEHYEAVLRHWQQMEQLLLEQPAAYRERVHQLVDAIDQLVLALQQDDEQLTRQLSQHAILSMLLMLGMVLVIWLRFNHSTLRPLADMASAAMQLRDGDFSRRIDHRQQNELGQLAASFNHMADGLAERYDRLEHRVSQKNRQLERSHTRLELLYDASRHLLYHPLDQQSLPRLLDALTAHFDTFQLRLCLSDTPFERQSDQVRLHCLANSQQLSGCAQDCSRNSTQDGERSAERPSGKNCQRCLSDEHRRLRFTLEFQQQAFGILLLTPLPGSQPAASESVTLSSDDHSLLQAFCDIIAASLYYQQATQRKQRIALLDERASIARELHDSLAQSLSYLKIQVARLAMRMEQSELPPAHQQQLSAITQELETGLSEAYRQLRELITTFRVSLQAQALPQALSQLVDDFRSQAPEIRLNFENQLGHCQLEPAREIHLLQIVREAINNALQHAEASQITLSCHQQSGRIAIQVVDDGIGIPEDPYRLHHYGIAIMRERAERSGARISIGRHQPTGTRVALRLDCSPPASAA